MNTMPVPSDDLVSNLVINQEVDWKDVDYNRGFDVDYTLLEHPRRMGN